jgi:hypothetical protein
MLARAAEEDESCQKRDDEGKVFALLDEWTLDGVVLGTDAEDGFDATLLNVAVGGVCRNVVDVFGGKRSPLEDLYVGLVAEKDSDGRYVPRYVPIGGNRFSSPNARDPVVVQNLSRAWRVGKVVDIATVKDPKSGESSVGINVVVERLDASDLRELTGNQAIGRDIDHIE